jgi:hypothetical protein
MDLFREVEDCKHKPDFVLSWTKIEGMELSFIAWEEENHCEENGMLVRAV